LIENEVQQWELIFIYLEIIILYDYSRLLLLFRNISFYYLVVKLEF
jgi:hypothetical protein